MFNLFYPECMNATGAIFSEIETTSCVLIGREWVLGSAHTERNLENVTGRVLSFDLFDGGIFREKRRTFSLNPLVDEINENTRHGKFWYSLEIEVGLFKVNKDISGKLPEFYGVKPVKTSNNISVDEKVYAVGYPEGGWLRVWTPGVVTHDFKGASMFVADFDAVSRGMSGGPVFSENGEVVGVLYEREKGNGFLCSKISALYGDEFKGFPFDETNLIKMD